MGKNYFIADTHFFHEKIIKMCNRPFDNVEEMNRKLIENWNKKVTDDDTIYIFCLLYTSDAADEL